METGSNKSLFTLIAVVIFGVFLSLSYFLFKDEMKNVLATVMDKTGFSVSTQLEKTLTNAKSYFSSYYFDNNTKSILGYKVYGFSGTPESGNDGSGLVFDGTGDYLESEDNSIKADGTESLTYEGWISINKFSSEYDRDWNGIFGVNSHSGLSLGLDRKSGDKLRFTLFSVVDLPPCEYKLEKDTLYHIVGVLDADKKRIFYYINGELITSADITSYYPKFESGTYFKYIGAWNPLSTFDGTIYNASVHDKVLTAEEISSNYNLGIGI